jgi:glycosyltransferase involved in cell wall biosynthesis
LSPLKGVDAAIRALTHLGDASLDVLGTGPPAYERRLRSLAQALGIGARVRFNGRGDGAQVAAAYAAADALLFPARWDEPFGCVPLEALASGTPVVATGTGGTAEFLEHERTALIVPRGDAAAVAAAVCRLRDDHELRRRLRRAGRAAAERYPAERSHRRVREALELAARRRNAIRRSA